MLGSMSSRILGAAALVVGMLIGAPVAPAGAENPACPANFAPVIVHLLGDHVRAKVCYRSDTDNWRFQDTYGDGHGALFRPPSNDLARRLWLEDADGANNGWMTRNSDYPRTTITAGICTMDFETGVNYGCTSATIVT
ncbi:hypothetical protein ACFJIY_21290 [Pimelobacter simplex]|uniref:hypothetical protein n=1 Tax=Nocardioides simplex TaxID=2045 RepID=UPI00366F4E02